jgi:hypothetical protein
VNAADGIGAFLVESIGKAPIILADPGANGVEFRFGICRGSLVELVHPPQRLAVNGEGNEVGGEGPRRRRKLASGVFAPLSAEARSRPLWRARESGGLSHEGLQLAPAEMGDIKGAVNDF